MAQMQFPQLQQMQLQQQAIPGLVGSVIIGGYDPSDGSLRVVNLAVLMEPLVVAEARHSLDRLDERNTRKTLTVPAATVIGTALETTLEVPVGEVWFINRFTLTTPADVVGNIRVSRFITKEADGKDRKYLGTNQAVSLTVSYDLPAQGQLGEELRLVGGDKLAVVGITTGVPGADEDVVLTCYGRKGKRLV